MWHRALRDWPAGHVTPRLPEAHHPRLAVLRRPLRLSDGGPCRREVPPHLVRALASTDRLLLNPSLSFSYPYPKEDHLIVAVIASRSRALAIPAVPVSRRPRGSSARSLPGSAFITSLRRHDRPGSRP